MTAELVRGQNHPLVGPDLQVHVTAERPVIAGAALCDAEGRTREGWLGHPGAAGPPGVSPAAGSRESHRITLALDEVPGEAESVRIWLTLTPGGPVRFGAIAAPRIAVLGPDGVPWAGYSLTGLDGESAVTAVELYRRAGAWKVRAVGQGYAGGLSALCADHGLPDERARSLAEGILASVAAPAGVPGPPTRAAAPGTAAAPGGASARPEPQPGARVDYRHPTRPGAGSQAGSARNEAPQAGAAPNEGPPDGAQREEAPQPVAGDASGWSMEERLYNQVWGMFEDLARTVAAYRGAVAFADERLEKEIDEVLADPRTRTGPAADAARERARARQAELIARAQQALDRDLDQLAAESGVVEPALPAAFAGWDNPVWHGYRVPRSAPSALRLGDLSLPERIGLRIPMLVRLPLERGLWIDSGRGGQPAAEVIDAEELRREAGLLATAVAGRLLAVHPPGGFTVHVIDAAGSAAHTLRPLLDSGLLREAPARGAAGVSGVLGRLTERVDLVQLAVRNRAADALPPGLDTSDQLLLVHDFPHGFDDGAITQLRYLADEGPAVGVHLLLVADREDAADFGPLLDPLWRSLLRITPIPDDHVADPWVRHQWTYEPPHVPQGSAILPRVLGTLAEAVRARPGGRHV
ncbi:TerD family protein [Streptomyces sp. WMMC897]|uniref:TerD family protein n=1 Tax=Streptomyces sp. WMMC897 TaxID=3014782 RepID=UPI0022B6A1FC|nr:TerD family protein [Streptomyces sp. WMMC897]MCZ7413645.1 TerD family protein [Streptomyces sp. WMMC897]